MSDYMKFQEHRRSVGRPKPGESPEVYKARRFLCQGRFLEEQIRQKVLMREQLTELATATSAFVSGMPGKALDPHRLDGLIARMSDLDREILAETNRMLTLQDDIQKALDRLNDPTRRLVLSMRYVNQTAFQEIADRLFLDESTVYRHHRRGLEELGAMLPEEEEDS